MEINIKNAFCLAVKTTYRPCIGKYRIFAENVETYMYQIAVCLLEKPMFTTVIFTTFSIFFVVVLSAILIILSGILISVLTIFLMESKFHGFVALLFLVTVCALMAVVGFIITILTIIGTEYKMQEPT